MGRARTISWTTQDEIDFVLGLIRDLERADRINRLRNYVNANANRVRCDAIDMTIVISRCRALISKYQYEADHGVQ